MVRLSAALTSETELLQEKSLLPARITITEFSLDEEFNFDLAFSITVLKFAPDLAKISRINVVRHEWL